MAPDLALFFLHSRILLSHISPFFFISLLAFCYLPSRLFLSRISHIFHLALDLAFFLIRISLLSYLTSRIFYLASRILLSRISNLPPEFFSSFIKSHLECSLQASVESGSANQLK